MKNLTAIKNSRRKGSYFLGVMVGDSDTLDHFVPRGIDHQKLFLEDCLKIKYNYLNFRTGAGQFDVGVIDLNCGNKMIPGKGNKMVNLGRISSQCLIHHSVFEMLRQMQLYGRCAFKISILKS